MAEEKQNPFEGVSFQDLIDDSNVETVPEKKQEEKQEQEKSEEHDDPKDTPLDKIEDDEEGDDPLNDPADESEETLFDQLNKEFGFEIQESFNEDYDGIKTYVSKAGQELAKKEFEKLFEDFPEIADYIAHVENGGNPKDFYKSMSESFSMSNIEITDDNEDVQVSVIRQKLLSDGLDKEDVDEKIESYKSAALLKKEAESALKILVKREELQKKADREQYEQNQKLEQEKYNKQLEEITGVIKSGVLANVQVPEKDKQGFYNFLFQPVDKSGITQRDLALKSMDTKQKLELEYILYKKLDIRNLILAKKQEKDLTFLRKQADKEKSEGQRRSTQSVRKDAPKSVLPEGVTISDFL